MSNQDQRDTGIPTRAIHEAYLQMQHAHREYRQARDLNQDTNGPQGGLQDAILSFYELVRPHLKHESALEDYWTGNLPDYTGWNFRSDTEARRYIRENGTGVYQVQLHPTTLHLDQQVLTDGGVEGFDDWHKLLGLSWDTERLLSIQPAEQDEQASHYAKVLRMAVLPLRELDRWQVEVQKSRSGSSGFMAGQTSVETRLEYQDPQKLITAKRLLVEATDKLGALSEFSASAQTTKITREDMEKVEQWRQDQLDT